MRLPRNLPREEGSLLITAVSGRALAQAARRAGFNPLVVDFFADADTQEAAHACRKLSGGISRGFRWQTLYPALRSLADAAPSPILGLVYGSGFEDRTELLRLIAKHWPLLGTDAATVARLKAPQDFFATLDRLGVAHPPTSSMPPSRGGAWLAKKRGGAGGSHIKLRRAAKAATHVYYQERVAGRSLSALFIANGGGARVLGFSEQWTAPRRSSPWRYGGAVCPAMISAPVARRITAAVMKVARAFSIKGIASADFVVRDEVPLLLEINPRPGATLDIFDRGVKPLLRVHMEAISEGKLPSRAPTFPDAMASAIVYAEYGGPAPPGTACPAWVADRPKPSEWIDKNRPICTVLARARTAAGAKRLVATRRGLILKLFQSISTRNAGERHRTEDRTQGCSLAERQHQGGAARQGAHR
jgi:predicted ATP-grasp superfamily ATP-dependent carboligase